MNEKKRSTTIPNRDSDAGSEKKNYRYTNKVDGIV